VPLSAEAQAALDGPPRSFILDNELYEVMPDEWWPALLTIRLDHPWAFSFLLGVSHYEDGVVLAERLIDEDDPLEQDDLVPIAQQLVRKATGREWYVAGRLAVITSHHWASIDGRLLTKNVDLLPLLKKEPSRALNLVRGLMYENADERRQMKLDEELDRPPASALKERRSTREDAAAFEAAFAAGADM